jgi:acyl-CoA synthetase (NDP forming)
MTTRASALTDLTPFFAPQSVAIVGATENVIRIGGRPLDYMLRYNYQGRIYPVHPKLDKVQGVIAYRALIDIPGEVELCIVAVSAALTEGVVREGLANGTRAFVVFGSGYAELNEEGRQAQERLAAMCAEHNALLLGPNCIGCADSHSRLIASFSTAMDTSSLKQGRFGLVTQSGALGSYWMAMLDRQGLGFSKFIATGNEAGVDLAQGIAYLAEDDATDVIGVYIESIKDAAAFRMAAIKAAQAGKPVVAIKAGRSEVGAEAAASHTGSLAGEDVNYQAFFDQFGIVRVNSLSEMIDTARLAIKQPPPAGRRVGIVTISGGAGVLLADELEERGLETSDFSDTTKNKLVDVLPSFIHPRNPLDHTAAVAGDPKLFDDVIKIVGESEDHDSIIVFSGLLESIADKLVASLKTAFQDSGKQIGVVWLGASPFVLKELDDAGIPVFADIPQAASAFEHVAFATEHQQRVRRLADRQWPAIHKPVTPQQAQPLAGHQNDHSNENRFNTLTEHIAADKIKSLCDLNFPKQSLIPGKGLDLSEFIDGLQLPLVAKLQSDEMTHRSDQGGVILNLGSPGEVQNAVDSLFELAAGLNINIDGVLLQETHQISYELIVGIRNDDLFGPMLVIGRGGIDVELRPDVQIAALPLTAEEIKAQMLKLESADLFTGHRGRALVDLDALASSLLQLTTGYLNDGRLHEIEINPLAVTTSGQVVALDALGSERSR